LRGIEEAINRASEYVQAYQPQLKIEVESRSDRGCKKKLRRQVKERFFVSCLIIFRPAQIKEALT
jgi:hypothetical protein